LAGKNLHVHCELCLQKRDLTFHHLIPRKLHRRKSFRKRFDRETLRRGIYICGLCHKGLHKLYDEHTLARQFSDRESIIGDTAIARHIGWSARQKITVSSRSDYHND